MSDEPDPKRLEELQAKIDALKGKPVEMPEVQDHYHQAQHAWRMVVELVSGLGIGFVVGWGLDWMFGTLPIFLILFTLLGFVAGVKTMVRTAQELQKGNVLGLQVPGVEGEKERGD